MSKGLVMVTREGAPVQSVNVLINDIGYLTDGEGIATFNNIPPGVARLRLIDAQGNVLGDREVVISEPMFSFSEEVI